MHSRRLIISAVLVPILTTAAGLAWWWTNNDLHLPAIPARQFEPPPPPGGAGEIAARLERGVCGKLPRPVPVLVIGGSHDVILIARFSTALEGAINDTPPLQLTDRRAPCVLVVDVAGGPNWRAFGGTIDPETGYDERTMITYRVNVYQEGGPFLGSFVGSCWLDEAEKCGKRAAEDVLTAALSHRSW